MAGEKLFEGLPSQEPTPAPSEAIFGQATSAYSGYVATLNGLNKNRNKSDLLAADSEVNLTTELDQWLDEDKLAYLGRAQEADPTLSFTLVATPNVWVTSDEIMNLADNVDPELYLQCFKYRPGQLSGFNPNAGSFNFSLVPLKFDVSLQGTAKFQLEKLAKMQQVAAFLKVPLPLEAYTHAETLKASGELTGPGNPEKTYVRCFDLPTLGPDAWQAVPEFRVNNEGISRFDSSLVNFPYPARLSIG